MDLKELDAITGSLKEKFPDVGIKSLEVDQKKGTSTFFLEPTKKLLAFLDNNGKVPAITPRYADNASSISRSPLSRAGLDLGMSKDAYDLDPKDAYKKAIRYYYTDPVLGSATNLLASLATKGFAFDIDDPKIKSFYDSWAFDVNLSQVIDWIMLDFFKVGHVTTYKVIAKYTPKVSNLSSNTNNKTSNAYTGKSTGESYDTAAKKNIWSKGHLPVSYTVLNPLLVTIDGNLLFNQTTTKVTLPTELKELLKKSSSELTPEEKALIKILPPSIKDAAKNGTELQLDSRLVGSITYRKQPYERYAKPRMARIFDTIEYKHALKEADLSTLDGISNYILKITVGSDQFPVTSQAELEAVAQLFNTSSKSFDVVWNHTLNIEKIVSPEISSILGQGKYQQVNEDLMAGLSIPRALLDGSSASKGGSSAMSLAVKGVMEEINYARRQVANWMYKEFAQIADAMGFKSFPKVRWDNGVLKDTLLYMNTVSQLVDRRMLSYRTALEALNFDYPNELNNMTNEVPLVEKGIFGIIGSPWQQSNKNPGNSPSTPDVQPVQNAPKGTPSNGRPKGKVTTPKAPVIKTSTKESSSVNNILDIVKSMTAQEHSDFIELISSIK